MQTLNYEIVLSMLGPARTRIFADFCKQLNESTLPNWIKASTGGFLLMKLYNEKLQDGADGVIVVVPPETTYVIRSNDERE